MWFGTNFGLNRYDGYNFVVYKVEKNDTTGLLYNVTSEIQEDINGDLWIKGNPYYVVYNYKKELFSRNLSPILTPLGLKPNPDLVEINVAKNYFFYYANDGIYKYDIKQKKLSHYPQKEQSNAPGLGIISSIRATESHCWILFESGLIERLDVSTGQIDFRSDYVLKNLRGSSVAKNLFVDSSGTPWVFPGPADRGVLYYDMQQFQWIAIDKSNDSNILSDFIRDIKEDTQGRIWIATDHGGINIVDKKTGKTSLLRHDPMNPESLGQNSAISLYCDDTETMWVGTYKNGVSYYNPRMFKFDKSPLFFYYSSLLETKDCNALFEDSKGYLWIGTNGEGLIRYNKSDGSFRVFRNNPNDPSSISSDIIISILEDYQGKMWFGTFMGGINRLEGERFVRYLPDSNNSNCLSNKSAYGMVEDKNHNIWIATLGGGICKLDSGRKQFSTFNTQNTKQLSSNFILSLYSKDSVTIYLSTTSGVDILNTKTNSIVPYFKENEKSQALSDPIIYNTTTDSHGNLWMATDNGINIYNLEKKKMYYLTEKDGLPSGQIVSIAEDNSGKIWAGTRNGLACITPLPPPKKDIKNDTKNDSILYSIITFDEKDGLASSTCNQNAIFKNRNGNIYIGSIKGYTYFNPSKIPFNTKIPNPSFTELRIGNQVVKPGQKNNNHIILEQTIIDNKHLALKYNENNFSLSFSALNYLHPEKNKYRYILKGLDETWKEIEGIQGMIAYSNLSPGSYQLIIYAGNNDNIWNETPLTLKITVHPPFWLAWWALTIYVLLIVGFSWFVLQYLLNRQRKEFEDAQRVLESKQIHEMDEMKFRFFTNISHEFRTPITLIINPVERLLQITPQEESRNLLKIIHNNANSLLELVNQLLDFRKLDVQKAELKLSIGDVVRFIKDICYSFSDWANKKSIHLTFSTSINELRMEFDPEKLKKIVLNLLSNAFKFTPNGGKIDVGVSIIQEVNTDERTLKIVITDSGIGIAEEHLNKIFDRFYRIENPDTPSQPGTGVGLHIVSEYIHLHHGEIKVDSVIGKGSEFTLLLPVNTQGYEEVIVQSHKDTQKSQELKEIIEKSESPTENKTLPLLLIVDDNEDFRLFMASMFQSSFRIITAENGLEAHQIILDKIPDMIISDVMMPKIDGLELCKLLKEDIRTSHIPIILLTAKASDDHKYSGLEAGADDYISKPFNMDLLKLKVSQLIEKQRKTQEKFKNRIAPSEIEITSLDEKFLKKSVEIVEKNIGNADFSVEDMGKEMGMSRVHLYKKILSLTSKTPSEFIRFIRLKRATELLEKSQLFINEIAFQTGFNDVKYFRKYFKDEFGVAPNEYKKQFEK